MERKYDQGRDQTQSDYEHRLFSALLLQQTQGLSDAPLRKLVQAFELTAIPHLSADIWQHHGASAKALGAQLAIHDADKVRWAESTTTWLADNKVQLLALGDPDYPALLAEISDPPPLLWVRGKASLLSTPQIGIVGCRKASHQGLQNAQDFASQLAAGGFTITSGLALGIDARAHAGALDVSGNTIAVLGAGVDQRYPTRNAPLYEQIIEQGALVSEFIPGSAPHKTRFPKRNRIISGLSLATLVVEAALKSGSLITARTALEQNREVFAVPGSIHNPVSVGCNELIKNGASLAQSAEDIVEQLGGWTGTAALRPSASTDESLTPYPELLEALGFEPTPLDILIERCDTDAQSLLPKLTELELAGHIEQIAGCWQRVR